MFSNCKINIGLHITGKRPDGFHNLETVFYPVLWKDALEIVQSEKLQITNTGIAIPGDPQKNLCIKAWHLLKKDFNDLPPVHIYVHKTIPIGAGLGGGSGNGAGMLKLLNRTFSLGISDEKLIEYSLSLGSDCPFFILNKPAFASGRGEQLFPISLDLKGYTLVLVNPCIHIDTRWAFSQILPSPATFQLKNIENIPIQDWKNVIKNDFQKPVIKIHPLVGEIIETLYKQGALYASMSGSGSTCYGIFPQNLLIEKSAFPQNFLVKQIPL